MSQNNSRDFNRREFLKGIGAAGVVAAVPAVTAAGGVFPRRLSDKVVKIGVVGGNFGSLFQWHLDPNCRVTAVCDLREDRLKRMVEAYGPASQYRSFRDFLRHPELDAVAVFTPAPLHVWMATEAMKAGKHVISAVPAGMSVEELELLLETVKKTGMKYMMAETSYYRPQVITCREWARQGKFGTIFYTEAEYHHEGLIPLMFDERGFPTWRCGFPPMHYPTHSTGIVIPITGERLIEVQAIGWGDGHEVLATNEYGNPFWNTTAFFRTSGGHCSRISLFWHVAAGGTERGSLYGTLMSYIMERPEGSPNTVVRISKEGRTVIDANGYPEGDVKIEAYKEPTHWDVLPPPMRVPTGHGGSHTFLTHEFISAIIEDRWPTVNVYEAIAFTVPGIIAHRSALRDGELMKIQDYGKAAA
ncbi:MAG: Gfo/Idh/MocA family oxidoreductase [Acidobacteriia bacterium]|nr:Gfo/Idh/MocA family oxidoreductase [Terriglobia bacterium]